MNHHRAVVWIQRPRVGKVVRGLAVAAVLCWVTTLLVHVTYYGRSVSIAAERGYLAVYWGDEDARNMRLLNKFTWPDLPQSGLGASWSKQDWGRWAVYGQLDKDSVSYALQYPTNALGLFLPGVGIDYGDIGYIGLPIWPLAAGALATWGLHRFARRGFGKGLCCKCGYSRSGLATAAVCPECGNAEPTPLITQQ